MDIGNIQLTDKEIQAGNINIPVIKGAPGKNGYTPVKGKDYWTTQDKEEIIQEVNQEFNNKLEEKADKAEVETQLDAKVDKEEGKGLSEENFTKEDKQKLEIIVPETTKSLQGTSFHIPDSAEAPMKISPRGNDIEQEISEASKNKCPDTMTYWESGDYDGSTGKKVTYQGRLRLKELLRVKPNETYYFNLNTTNSNMFFILRCYDKNKNFISSYGALTVDTFTPSENNYYLGVSIYDKTNMSADLYETFKTMFDNGTLKPFICLNSETDKEYVPFSLNMPSLDFPSPVKHVGGKVKSYNLFDKAAIKQGYYVGSTGGVTAQEGVNLSDYIAVKPNSTYHIGDRGDWASVGLYNENKEYIERPSISTGAYTTNENTYFIRCNIESGYEDTFQIIEGTSSKPYLPYGDIGSVYDIANVNKNVFKFGNVVVEGSTGITVQKVNENKIILNGTASVVTRIMTSTFKKIANKNMVLTAQKNSGTQTGEATLVIYEGNNSWVRLSETASLKNVEKASTVLNITGLSSETYQNGIWVDKGTVFNNLEIEFQMEYGETSSNEIVAHEEKKYSLDLTNLPLYSDKDYIYKKDDKWYVYNEWGKYTFNGTEITRIAGENADTIQFQCVNLAIKKVGLSNISSNYFKSYYGDVNKETILGGSSNTIIQFLINKDRNITTVEGLNALFKKLYDEGNPIYAIYELITPTETEITDKKVIAVLEELYNTYAYDEVTNISVDNPILSAELVLDVLYYQKTALGLETKVSYEEYSKLLKRVEELENVILTLGGTI